MEDIEAIKSVIDYRKKYKVYYIKSAPSEHTIRVTEFYAELIKLGANIFEFKRKDFGFKEKVRPDAFIDFEINGKGKLIFLEVDIFNKTDPAKYLPLYNSNYFQKKYNVFPTLLIISNKKYNMKYPFKVGVVGYDMKEINKYISY
jgi:hypothetical protein